MSVAIAPMASRARLDHHVISRAHRTARVRSHYLSPPSPVIPRGALPAAKGPRKGRRFPAPPMPATRRAADPSADACVWTDTEETCAVKSKALNTEQCGVPDDAGLNWNLLSESQCDLTTIVKFRRNHEWREYQSSRRWFQQLTTINGSVVARRVTFPALVITAWAVAVSIAANTVTAPWLWNSVSSASQFVGVVGGAVSLLLVFRTNAAFGRFCAAADSFAEVLSATRNLSRKMAVWAPVSHRVENARLCAAIPWAVKHRGQGIHGTEDASEELESVLTPAQLKKLDLMGNVPAQLMTEITRGLDRMNEHKVELIYQLLMDNDLTALHNYAAKTDRLAQTPTPVSYTRHISRSLMLWLLTMPVCSVGAGCPWWITGLGTALVSWLLLGIDDLGMQLEQPYTVMALKQFCEDVQDEVVPETGDSDWTPRIGAPREDVVASAFLNSELTSTFSDMALVNM